MRVDQAVSSTVSMCTPVTELAVSTGNVTSLQTVGRVATPAVEHVGHIVRGVPRHLMTLTNLSFYRFRFSYSVATTAV